MAKDLAWRDAIIKVLKNSDSAMHYKDIADEVVSRELRKKVGATPPATVATCLSLSLSKEGENSPFQKVGPGEYILRHRGKVPTSNKAVAEKTPTLAKKQEQDTEDQYDIVSSFGMLWRRDFVDWKSSPSLLGMQQIGAEAVDFYSQIGIYLLYDGREIIYVGRSTDRRAHAGPPFDQVGSLFMVRFFARF